jgi:hypothetical protein
MTNKQAGWVLAGIAALVMCNGDLRCAAKKLLGMKL